MASLGRYQLQRWRLVAAFVVAPAAVVAVHAGFMWPLWEIALFFGFLCAAALTLAVALPYVFWLARRGNLKLLWILLAAGLFTAAPDLAISVAGAVFGNDTEQLYASGHYLVIDGKLTTYAIFHFFIVRPAAYGLLGVFGGIVFWLIAVGWRRLQPPTSNKQMHATQ